MNEFHAIKSPIDHEREKMRMLLVPITSDKRFGKGFSQMLDVMMKSQNDDIDSDDTSMVAVQSKVFISWLYCINSGADSDIGSLESPLLRKGKVGGYIGSIWDIPEDIRDNLFILTGYRVGFDSVMNTWPTIFMWHNETMNVWTHLLGKIATWITLIFLIIYIPNYERNGLELQDKLSNMS